VFSDISSFANITSSNITATGNVNATDDINGNNNFNLVGNGIIGGVLSVAGDSTFRGDLSLTTGITNLRSLVVNGRSDFNNGNVTISGVAGVVTINNPTDINATLTVSGYFQRFGINRFEEGFTTFYDDVFVDGSSRLLVDNVPVENPRISPLTATGNISLTYLNQFTSYMFTGPSGLGMATVNFRTTDLNTTTGIWYVKNARPTVGADITVNHSGSPITGSTAIIHGRSLTNNTPRQTLYWNGTDLFMY
jgi:hypothetical protein